MSKLKDGDSKILAACDECYMVIACDEGNFPMSGYWRKCHACDTFRMFFALEPLRRSFKVVNESNRGGRE